MEKIEAVISSVYARKDIDGTLLGFTIGVKESKDANSDKGYVYRYDYSPASFEKAFGFKDEIKVNTLVGQHCYIVRSLQLK